LFSVADLARVLPRHWDGRRLLRFLAGLAMLALAFTAPASSEPAAFVAAPAVSGPAAFVAPPAVSGPAAFVAPPAVSGPAGFAESAPANAAAPAADAASPDVVASVVDRSFGELPLPLLPSTLVVAVAVAVLARVATRVRAPRAPPAV
jgi:hypothetical protein